MKKITFIFKVKLPNSNENFCFYFKVCDILFSVRCRFKTFALKPDLVLQTIYSLKYWIEKNVTLTEISKHKSHKHKGEENENKLEISDDMLFFCLPTSLLSDNGCHSLKHLIFTKSGQTFSWVPSLRIITNEKQIWLLPKVCWLALYQWKTTENCHKHIWICNSKFIFNQFSWRPMWT